jgi:type I restriction enzyme S subunit
LVIDEKRVTVAGAAASGVPDGWRAVRFGDVVRNVDVSERQPLEQGLERFVGLEHLDPESLHINRWGLIEEGTSFTRKFVRGQVLFGKRRAYQRKAAVAGFDGICSGDILVFEPKGDELLPELLPFIVQSDGFFEYALGTSAGSLSPRTKWSDLARYEFALPPKDEQRRIADIFSELERAMNKWQEVIWDSGKLLRTYREEVFIYKSVSANNKVALANVSSVITKGESPSWQGFDYQSSGVRFITSENVLFGKFQFAPEKFIPNEFHEKLRRSKINSQDLLINLVGASIGRACIVPQEINDANINQAVAVVKLNKSKILPEFALAYILSETAMKKLLGESVNTARANLSLKNIRDIELPLPSLDSQYRICEVIRSMNKNTQESINHTKKLSLLKKQLLQSLTPELKFN